MDVWACAMSDTVDRCSSTVLLPWPDGVWKKAVSCLDVWHRIVNHQKVRNGNVECHTTGLTCRLLQQRRLQHLTADISTSNADVAVLPPPPKKRAAFTNWLRSCLLQYVQYIAKDKTCHYCFGATQVTSCRIGQLQVLHRGWNTRSFHCQRIVRGHILIWQVQQMRYLVQLSN